jgi:hypothetical protein
VITFSGSEIVAKVGIEFFMKRKYRVGRELSLLRRDRRDSRLWCLDGD